MQVKVIPSSAHFSPSPVHLVFAAPLQADVHVLRDIGWDVLPEQLDVLAIDLLGHSKGSVDNLRVEGEEVLCDLAGSGVFAVQTGNKGSLVAVIVELEVDAALRENSAVELVQIASDFWVLGRAHQPILKHVAELEVGPIDQSEKLSGARVHVRSVDAAGLEEAESCADAQAGQDGKAFDVGSLESAACCVGRSACPIEAEDRESPEGGSCEEGVTLD